MPEFLSTQVGGGLVVEDLLILAVVTAVGWVVGLISDRLLDGLAIKAPDRSLRKALLLSFDGPLRWAITVAGIFAGIHYVSHDASLEELQLRAFVVLSLPFALWFGLRLVDQLTGLWEHKAQATESSFDDQLVPVVRTGSKLMLWVVIGMLIVQNLGGEVGSLLAGFGLGGLAVAMASKDTIANLFGSLVIFVDRPFMVGDWVQIGDEEGVVEEVGLRVTRIRTFAKSVITVPNAHLTTTPINNWSRMHKRRIKLTVGVTYDTDADQLEKAVNALRESLLSHPMIEKEGAVVQFNNLGASSLDIFVYCFATTTDWAEYLQVQQDVLLGFMRVLADMGVDMAFPTQTIHLAPGSAPTPGLASTSGPSSRLGLG